MNKLVEDDGILEEAKRCLEDTHSLAIVELAIGEKAASLPCKAPDRKHPRQDLLQPRQAGMGKPQHNNRSLRPKRRITGSI